MIGVRLVMVDGSKSCSGRIKQIHSQQTACTHTHTYTQLDTARYVHIAYMLYVRIQLDNTVTVIQ